MSSIKWNPEHLEALDNHLRDRSYIEGWSATQSDSLLIHALEPVTKNLTNYVHITRWWKHMKTFKNHELEGMARSTEEVVSKFGTTSETVRVFILQHQL